MTRASDGETTFDRSQTRRSGNGSGYPLWMRTLEEKYQKLHKKITENTGTARFTSCVGRSVYDTKLSQALTRYKDISATQRQIIRAKSSKVCAINTNNENDLPTENAKENWQNQYLNKTDTIYADNVELTNCENLEENGPVKQNRAFCCEETKAETSSEKSAKNENEQIVDVTDSGEDKVKKIKANEDVRADNLDRVFSKRVTNHISFDKNKTSVKCDNDKLEADKYCRRNLKTSTSRISKVTTKSCPAKIQSHAHRLGHRQLLAARSKSANRTDKMFTPMSEEAKHAINETIHEMSVSGPSKLSDNTGVKFIPSRGRICVKSWVSPKKVKNSYDVRNVLESASQCLTNMNSDGVKAFDRLSNNDDGSCHSSTGSTNDGPRRPDSRLPEIQNGSARGRNIGMNQSYRLPGIGKYNISHADPVFEITPPGFDSRYNDLVPPVEERESETPPPDIRQRAIDKCSEWLTKYNK